MQLRRERGFLKRNRRYAKPPHAVFPARRKGVDQKGAAMENKGTHIRHYRLNGAIALLVALALLLVTLASYVNQHLEESGEQQALAFAEQSSNFMGERARYIQSALASFAVETDDPAQLVSALASLRDAYGFTRVGFAQMNETGIDADGKPFTLDDITQAETAISQGVATHSSAYLNASNEYVHLAQTPVYLDGKQVGALYAQVPLSLFLSNSAGNAYAEDVEEFIFDGATGEIVATSLGTCPSETAGTSMYSYIEQAIRWTNAGPALSSEPNKGIESALTNLRAEVGAGRSSLVIGQVDGVESYLCVTPTGNGSWFATTVVPVSTVRSEARVVQIVFTAMFLLSIVCVALAAVLGITAHRRRTQERHVEMRRQLYNALSDCLDMAVSLYAPKIGQITPIVAKDIDVLGESLEALLRRPEKARGIGMSPEGLELIELIRLGKPSELFSREFSIAPDGVEERFIECTIRPLAYDGLGQLLIILRDVTEERALQHSMKAAMDAAEAANSAKSEFLSRMSHEIRTPMNVIIGMLELARNNQDDPARLAENLRHIETASEHLLDLINEVLDIAKIESGKIDLNDAPFNLMGMLESLNEVIEPLCAEKNQRYVFKAEGPVDATFVGDEMSLRHILVNLLTNAVKYTGEGGTISLAVSIVPSLASGYQRITFTVSDNGIGMSEEYLAHLFEPFVVEGRSSAQGTGLGMPIVRNIVNAMGGDIHVETRLNKGTTFTVAVNKRLAEEGATGPDRSTEQEAVLPQAGGPQKPVQLDGVRVLLVEDNPLNAEIASELLSISGLEVTWAEDGMQACELFEQAAPGTFDVVLMDVRMPRMDGHEATRTIRSMPRDDAQRIPIIAMSANAFVDDVLASLKSGMNAHLSKPINMGELLATIARELNRE